MSNFCKTCHYYEKGIFTRAGESFGVCHNIAVATKVAVDGESVLGGDGIIYTEEYFGCVYWRADEGRILDIRDTIKGVELVCKTCGKYPGDCKCNK